MQYLWLFVHLKDMKKILLMLMLATSCSAFDFSETETGYEYDAEWASAYYLGTRAESGTSTYLLAMVQGRTDGDMELVSSGAAVFVVLNAPQSNDIALPSGKYDGITSTDNEPFTFGIGKINGETVSGSYIGVKLSAKAEMQRFPIESGNVTITSTGDDEYSIDVEVKSSSSSFEFSYSGTVTTYDGTGFEGNY